MAFYQHYKGQGTLYGGFGIGAYTDMSLSNMDWEGEVSSFTMRIGPNTGCQLRMYDGGRLSGDMQQKYAYNDGDSYKYISGNIVHQSNGGLNDLVSSFELRQIIWSLDKQQTASAPGTPWSRFWGVFSAKDAEFGDQFMDFHDDELNRNANKYRFNFDSKTSLLIVSALSVSSTMVIMCFIFWWCSLSNKKRNKYNQVSNYNHDADTLTTDIE